MLEGKLFLIKKNLHSIFFIVLGLIFLVASMNIHYAHSLVMIVLSYAFGLISLSFLYLAGINDTKITFNKDWVNTPEKFSVSKEGEVTVYSSIKPGCFTKHNLADCRIIDGGLQVKMRSELIDENFHENSKACLR